jgi:hypothetical protein
MFTYSSRGKWAFPLSCGVFLPPPLLQAFLLLIAGCVPPLLPSLASLFIYSSCGKLVFPPLLWSFPPTTTFTSFPAPDYWVALLLLPAAVFIYSSHGKLVFLPLLWRFSPSTTLTSFPTPGCWERIPAPTRASPACPACLFTVLGRIPFPQSLVLSVPPPSYPHAFIVLIAYNSVSLFFPWWRSVCPGGMLLWPRVVCGSTTVPLSSPCPHLPKLSGCWQLAAQGPSWFLRLT